MSALFGQNIDESNTRLEALFASLEADADAGLLSAMRYAVFSGGKRVRSLVVRVCGGLLEGKDILSNSEGLWGAALAVELIHAYSLIHDDLPAMDDDKIRRGKPTVHVRFGEAQAILAGDGLQALAFEVLARSCLENSSDGRLLEVLGRYAGVCHMAGGQSIEIAAREAGVGVTREDRRRLMERKTGGLFAYCAEAAAIHGAASDKVCESFRSFGLEFGVFYQMLDDIKDGDVEVDGAEVFREQERAVKGLAECLPKGGGGLLGLVDGLMLA